MGLEGEGRAFSTLKNAKPSRLGLEAARLVSSMKRWFKPR
jgi:hypothetical protein